MVQCSVGQGLVSADVRNDSELVDAGSALGVAIGPASANVFRGLPEQQSYPWTLGAHRRLVWQDLRGQERGGDQGVSKSFPLPGVPCAKQTANRNM